MSKKFSKGSPDFAAAVKAASNARIGIALSGHIGPRLRKEQRWLEKLNIYSTDPIKAIKSHSINHQQLTEYVAVAGILHTFDGWSYLGRALNALMLSDFSRSIHFSYYAELRAALSILALEGIGVFNGRNIYIDVKGRCRLHSSLPTHKAVWSYLDSWGRSPKSEITTKLFRYQGVTFEDWIIASKLSTGSIAPHAWLSCWGTDIKNFANDHLTRNNASYQPSPLSGDYKVPLPKIYDLVCKIWESFVPTIGGYDENSNVDHLIDMYELYEKNAAVTNIVNGHIVPGMQVLGINTGIQRLIIDRYKNNKRGTLGLILDSGNPNNNEPIPVQMISRATMLLKLATLMARRSIGSSIDFHNDAKFWWMTECAYRGLWNEKSPPADIKLCWDDMKQVLADLVAGQQKSLDRYDISKNIRGTEKVEACELIGLYGMAA